MKVSFRVGRYLLALLWHWSLPFALGGVFASVLAIRGVQEGVELLDDALDASIRRVAESCSAANLEPATSLITRFSASVESRQVYSVVGPGGKARQVVGDSPLGRKGEPLAVVRDECHGDGASSCGLGEIHAVGVARNGRGGTPTKRCTNVQKRRCS